MTNQEKSIQGYGRVLNIRRMGKIAFADSMLLEERIQLVFKKDSTENFGRVSSLSCGDLLHVTGTRGVTSSGEKSLFVTNLVEITRNSSGITLQQMQNQQLRFQNRHIDLGLNQESFDFWKKVSLVTTTLRNIMSANEFLEFNTGVLQLVRDAGLASAFITRCDATRKSYALSLTCELKLKRLIAGGFSRVYEIAQSFRNEGINKEHVPEFSLMEAYATAWTSVKVADILEKMVKASLQVQTLTGNTQQDPYEKITFVEVWKEFVGKNDISLTSLCERFPTLFKPGMPEFTWIYKFICKSIAPRFQRGTFVTGLPHGFSPFAKTLENDGRFMDGGILIVGGLHLATYSADSNDYKTIRKILEQQSAECGVRLNEEFLDVLKFGLPPTAGFGLGVNRLSMLLLNKLPRDVRETCLYPLF